MFLTMLFLFLVINIVLGVLGIAFKLTFKLFRWAFGAALAIGIFVFYAVFAVPIAALVIAALVLYAVFWCLSRLV